MSFNAFKLESSKMIARTLPRGREIGIADDSINMQKYWIGNYVSIVNGFKEALEKALSAHFVVLFVSANINLYLN